MQSPEYSPVIGADHFLDQSQQSITEIVANASGFEGKVLRVLAGAVDNQMPVAAAANELLGHKASIHAVVATELALSELADGSPSLAVDTAIDGIPVIGLDPNVATAIDLDEKPTTLTNKEVREIVQRLPETPTRLHILMDSIRGILPRHDYYAVISSPVAQTFQ